MSADELSAIGAKCRRRATLEGERRWCDNKSEQLNDSQVKLTKREMLATLLDLELLYFFTSGRSDRSLPLLADAWKDRRHNDYFKVTSFYVYYTHSSGPGNRC